MITTEGRRARWEARVEWPLTLLAITFLVAYAVPILDPNLSSTWMSACRAAVFITWAAFAADYLTRLVLSVDRRTFVKANILDLLVVVLPLLRPLRLLRLLTMLSVLNRFAGSTLRGRVGVYVGSSAALILFVSSLAVLDAERTSPGANITSFGDSLWWSVTTVTTVGYGDEYPTSIAGRFIAAALMVSGIALLGVVTAAIATWLIEKVQEIEDDAREVTRKDLHDLRAEIMALRALLTTQRADQNVQSPDPA